MKRAHPIHAKNEDTACRWLCLCGASMTAQDREEVRKALQELPFQGMALRVPEVDMLARVK